MIGKYWHRRRTQDGKPSTCRFCSTSRKSTAYWKDRKKKPRNPDLQAATNLAFENWRGKQG